MEYLLNWLVLYTYETAFALTIMLTLNLETQNGLLLGSQEVFGKKFGLHRWTTSITNFVATLSMPNSNSKCICNITIFVATLSMPNSNSKRICNMLKMTFSCILWETPKCNHVDNIAQGLKGSRAKCQNTSLFYL
jgi:hypothetical protein